MNIRSKCWMVTIHYENIQKAGFTNIQVEDYPAILDYFYHRWCSSGKGRVGCFTACVSANGVFHIHGALFGEKTTRNAVARLMHDSHVEVCKGGKTNLMNYILKNPPYDESGETVLYVVGKDDIQIRQGKRTEFEIIEELLDEGYTPSEIMNLSFRYRKYETMIKSAFADKLKSETPTKKEIHREWHFGDSGTGKTYYYETLCKQYGPEEIFFTGYIGTGWLDGYMEAGAPSILFIDEFKPIGSWQELLNVLDIYSWRQIHARYQNIYPLWNNVVITSVYPPEEAYRHMVKNELKRIESKNQLMRRLDTIVYHYIENGVYKEYRMPASDYVDCDDLKQRIQNGI